MAVQVFHHGEGLNTLKQREEEKRDFGEGMMLHGYIKRGKVDYKTAFGNLFFLVFLFFFVIKESVQVDTLQKRIKFKNQTTVTSSHCYFPVTSKRFFTVILTDKTRKRIQNNRKGQCVNNCPNTHSSLQHTSEHYCNIALIDCLFSHPNENLIVQQLSLWINKQCSFNL